MEILDQLNCLLRNLYADQEADQAPENLFPLPQIQQNRSLGEGAGKWHRTYVNPANVTAKLSRCFHHSHLSPRQTLPAPQAVFQDHSCGSQQVMENS